MIKVISFLLFVTYFLIYYFIINHLFIEFNYIHSNLLYFAEKGLIALKGNPPRLENIGLIYPPFAFIPFLIVNDPFIIVPIVSSLITTFFTIYYIKLDCKNPYRFVIILLFIFNPLYLYLATQRFEILLFFSLISISFIFSVLFLMQNFTIYAFIAGLFLGLTFFIDFRSIFILPFFIISLFFSIQEKSFYYKFSIIIVKLTPIIFFFFSWLYINYIFSDDMFYFMKNPNSFFRMFKHEEFLVINFNIFDSLLEFLKFLTGKFFMLLPYFLLFPLILSSFMLHYSFPILVSFIVPLILIFTSIFHKITLPFYYDIILFLFFALTFKFLIKRNLDFIFMIFFLISFVLSFIMPLNSSELNEKNFIKALLNTASIPETLKLTEDLRVSENIKRFECKKVLADDSSSFPVIYFHGNPKDFILPYNYEFTTFMSAPDLYADCILVNITSKEDILKKNLSRNSDALNRFNLVYEGSKYRLFKKVVD